MTPIKLLIYRLRIHRLFKGLVSITYKGIAFLKFCEWVSENEKLELNDFPAKGNVYRRRYQVHEYLIEKELRDKPINYLEFGVADGETFYWWLKQNGNLESRFYGFDTFTGLPEDWGNYKKGSFDLDGAIPRIDDPRGKLYEGLFQATVYEFLKEFENDKQNFILLDADLYSSTLFVLTTIAPYLKNDDLVVYDEFSEPKHEFLAHQNFLQAFPHINLIPLAAANNYACVAFRVKLQEP